jgi:hypothetical protein
MKVNGSPNKYPHRKLILQSGDINIAKNNKIGTAKQNSGIIQRSDKFTTFKE